jgi:hypothetical protein
MVVEDGSGNIIQQIAHDPEHPQSLASGAAKIYTEFGESLDPYIGLVWLDVMRQTVESEFAPVYPLPSPDIWRVIVVSAHTRSTLDTFTFRNFDIEYRKDPSSAWEDYFKSPAARGSFIPIQERGYVGDFRWYWQDPGLYYPCLNELPAEPDRPDSPICRITLDAEGIEFLKSLPETRNTSEREISLTPYYK